MDSATQRDLYRRLWPSIPLVLLVMIAAASLAGCGQATSSGETPSNSSQQLTLTPVTVPPSDWGAVELIAQAETMDAPVFVHIREEAVFTWTGSEAGEARHFSRGITGNSQIMAISAYFPFQQQLFPIDRGALMLWMDRTDSDDTLRLQVASFSESGIALNGPIIVSTQRTRNYSAIALDERQIRAVWSGGLGEVTNLYMNQIDTFGRPVLGDVLRIDADYPALIKDESDNVHLFWLEDNGRNAYHATFDEIGNPTLTGIRRVASANLAGTDAITAFDVAYDGTDVYLFWNLRRINDQQFVLMSQGQLSDERFTTAVPLLDSLGAPVLRAKPADGIHKPLPVAANNGDLLSLLWLEAGAVSSAETVVTSGPLIGLPYIHISEAIIALSWAQPTSQGFANLFYAHRPYGSQ